MSAADAAWKAAGGPFPLAEVPKPTEIPAEHPKGVLLVTEDTLFNATATANRLAYLAGLTTFDSGMQAWLNDGSNYLHELVAAVRQMQRPLQ